MKIGLISVAAVLVMGSSFAQHVDSFVTVSNNTFRLAGQEYRAMRFTSYQLNVGDNEAKRVDIEKVFRSAKDNGFTLFQATSIIKNFKTGDFDEHLSAKVWTLTDKIPDANTTVLCED